MSAASETAASPSPCACTNISLMQLFHELKQKFPGVPDHVVSNTIELYCHDKHACETHLHSEAKASLTHAYHASSSAAARQLNELKVEAPIRCRNQPIFQHEVSCPTAVNTTDCQGPQTAIISTNASTGTNYIDNKNEHKLDTDANQNLVHKVNHIETQSIKSLNLSSPITVINLDNCVPKFSTDSPSDVELTNNVFKDEDSRATQSPSNGNRQSESVNYQIFKSNKIKSNLNEKLEIVKGKKTINKKEENTSKKEENPSQKEESVSKKEESTSKKEEVKSKNEDVAVKEEVIVSKTDVVPDKSENSTPQQPEIGHEKVKRPCTLEFLKPDIAFKQNLLEPNEEQCRTVSPVPSSRKCDMRQNNDTLQGGSFWQDRGCPLNLSVNVNCHMDLGRGYSDPWLEEFDSPRAVTSLNLTVCTPTSSMASPVRDRGEEDAGFESHFTVTVSPSSVRPAPRRRAPPPPTSATSTTSQPLEPQQSTKTPMGSTTELSLVARQRLRLAQLSEALELERARLRQLALEMAVLRAPHDAAAAARLRREVLELRAHCDRLDKRIYTNEGGSFYNNIYTGQRAASQLGQGATQASRPAPPPPSSGPPAESSWWQCHMCTFSNHPLLNNCEICKMARIVIVRAADGITVRLMPGRRIVDHIRGLCVSPIIN